MSTRMKRFPVIRWKSAECRQTMKRCIGCTSTIWFLDIKMKMAMWILMTDRTTSIKSMPAGVRNYADSSTLKKLKNVRKTQKFVHKTQKFVHKTQKFAPKRQKFVQGSAL